MEELILNEEQKSRIKLFIQEMSTIPMVESIYFIPFINYEGKPRAEVVVLHNDGSEYNKKIDANKMSRFLQDEFGYILNTTQIYNDRNDNILSFHTKSADSLFVDLMTCRKRLASKDLVSSTILFDRFGDMTKLRDYLTTNTEPYENIINTTNIDEVLDKQQELVLN